MSTEPTACDSRHNARLIIAARGFSDFGAFLNMVALSTYVYLLAGVFSLSVFLACRVAGGLLASVLGTPFYRHFSGRGPLIGLDVLRASLLVLLLTVPALENPILVPGIAFGLGLANSLFSIGLNSQMPLLVNTEHRTTTNAWVTSVAATAAVAGSLVSGLLVASNGFEAVFILNVFTYLVAALLVIPLRFSTPVVRTADDKTMGWNALRHALRSTPVLAAMLLLTLTDTLGSAAHNVGFPILATLLTPEMVSTTMGLMLAVWAGGKFIGARIGGHLAGTATAQMERVFFAGVLLMSCGFILMFAQHSLLWLLLFAFPAGLGDGMAEVALVSRLQREPDNLRLPIFSFLTLLQMTGFAVGMLIVAPFFTWWTPAAVILLFHGIPLGTLLLLGTVNRLNNLMSSAKER